MCLLKLGIHGGFSIYFTTVDFYVKFIAKSALAPCECVKSWVTSAAVFVEL
jgi:hypothetical protein